MRDYVENYLSVKEELGFIFDKDQKLTAKDLKSCGICIKTLNLKPNEIENFIVVLDSGKKVVASRYYYYYDNVINAIENYVANCIKANEQSILVKIDKMQTQIENTKQSIIYKTEKIEYLEKVIEDLRKELE